MSKLKNLKLPMLMAVGTEDTFADPKDFVKLLTHLPDSTKVVTIDGWGHIDFLWSDNADELLYQQAVEFINSNNGK